MAHFTDAQLEEVKRANPCDRLARKYVRLRKGGKLGLIGPCPIHSPKPDAADSTSFECNADGWVCASICHTGGDVIKLVQMIEGIDFVTAVERLGGVKEIDPEKAKQIEAERARKRIEAEKTNAQFREKARETAFEIWRRGIPIAGTAAEAYLVKRGLVAPPDGVRLRFIPNLPYWRDGKRSSECLHRGPALLAPIVRDGKFYGLHRTWIDLDRPKGRLELTDPETDAKLETKKALGSTKGGHIVLVEGAAPKRLVIGEGIEKVLAVWQAMSGEQIDIAYWTSISLGNLGGKAAGAVPHPTLKDAKGRARRVPGPMPDLSEPGIEIPNGVDEIIILGDSTSDEFTTRCAIARAAARWANTGRVIRAAWPPAGKDFDDLLREAADRAEACSAIAALIEQAQPVDILATIELLSASEASKQTKSAGTAGRPLDPSASSVVVPFPGPAVPPPGPAAVATETEKSSQTGALHSNTDDQGGGRRGDDGGAGGSGSDELNRRLAWFPQTDLGNAERFVARHRDTLMYCEAIGWLWWDGRRWAREAAEQHVKRAEHATVRAIQDEAKALQRAIERGEVKGERAELDRLVKSLFKWGRTSEANSKITSIEKNARAYLEVLTSELDADPLAINVKNGTLVIRREWPTPNGHYEPCNDWQRHGDYIRLKPHDPKDLITKLAPVEFDPKATREQFDRFIAEVQPVAGMRRFLQQWKGYSLTADASEHRMALFIGKGRNGKSVFEDATAYVAGDYAETVPIETFLASGREANANAPSPARALLHNSRMVRTSEPNKGAALDEGFIKLVTGGEPIQARNLNLPLFRFYPVLKLTVSGNHRPKIGGTDEGIWSRVTLVPWDVIIPPEKRDRQLTEKLRKEASGILNWMIDGLADWIEHGLVLPDEVARATAEYRRDSDQLGRFLEVCVVTDPDGRVQSSLLLTVFNAWARANGATEWTGRGLSNAMTERGYKKDKSSVMYWLGITLTKHESDFASGQPSGLGGSNLPRGQRGGDYGDGGGRNNDEIMF